MRLISSVNLLVFRSIDTFCGRIQTEMIADQVYKLRADLRDNGVVFAYSGYVSETVLAGVGDALKHKLFSDDIDRTTMRSVFAIFVEQMQNIIRYSSEKLPSPDLSKDAELSYGILTIGTEDGHHVVQAGNLLSRDDVDRMRARLTDLQTMSRDELKAAYKAQLKSAPEAGSKGAGIGLIEIARRASKPIEFDFMDVDDASVFFALKATI